MIERELNTIVQEDWDYQKAIVLIDVIPEIQKQKAILP